MGFSRRQDFYTPAADLDPDNGDHLLVCLGGDFTTVPADAKSRGRDNLPFRGIDSSYTSRWCQDSTVEKDAATGFPVSVTADSFLCNHYEPEEVVQIPHIKESVKAALDFLGKDDDGFFLMYEQGDVSIAQTRIYILFITKSY
jgi:alkaline phosphatase